MNSPIADAVLPLKSEAIEHANNEARRIAENVANMLKAAGYDLKVAAPYPNGNLSRPEYMRQLGRYNLFSSLTRWRKTTYSINEPMLADIALDRVAKFVKEAEEDAALEYDAFVAKLQEKIGPVVSAELEGNHVWSHSVLTVTKADGTVERWKTQMILNVSKLGKVFNQFPTRKVK